jgi:hypothetical protein
MAANKTFTTTPLLGVNFDEKRSTVDGPRVRVGTVVPLISDQASVLGKFAMYIQASGVIGNSLYCTIDLTTISCLGTSVDGGTGTACFRNGSVAFADSEYGWVMCVKTQIPQAPGS